MNNVIQMIDDAASYIRNHIDFTPQIAIILGSGLGPCRRNNISGSYEIFGYSAF